MTVTQYIGARYQPIFADPAEWNDTRTYEPLTIVLHNGDSYTSRQFVPLGTEITNKDYWLVTGNYNAQTEQYRQDVKNAVETVTKELNEQTENVENQLTTQNTYITNQITTQNANVEKQLADQNSKVTSQLTDQNSKVTSQLTDQNSKVTSQLTTQNTNIEKQLSDQNSKVTSQLTTQNTNIEKQLTDQNSKVTSQLTTQNQQVAEAISKVNLTDLFIVLQYDTDSKVEVSKSVVAGSGLGQTKLSPKSIPAGYNLVSVLSYSYDGDDLYIGIDTSSNDVWVNLMNNSDSTKTLSFSITQVLVIRDDIITRRGI